MDVIGTSSFCSHMIKAEVCHCKASNVELALNRASLYIATKKTSQYHVILYTLRLAVRSQLCLSPSSETCQGQQV